MYKRVSDSRIEFFIMNGESAKNLSDDDIRSMAVEIMRHRFQEQRLYTFLHETLEERENLREIKKVLASEVIGQC
jgi:nicotinamide riboside kinase